MGLETGGFGTAGSENMEKVLVFCIEKEKCFIFIHQVCLVRKVGEGTTEMGDGA